MRHARTPHTSDSQLVDFCLITEQVQGYPEVDRPWKVEKIIKYHGHGDDESLRNLRAVDTCEDVDAIGTECGQHGHIDVVQRTLRAELAWRKIHCWELTESHE